MENDKQELQFNPESMDCTIRGLESMVGEIANRPIRMSESANTFRFDQLAKGGKLVRKRLRECWSD